MPVWALPYVMPMDDHALVGFEEALQSMAHQERGRIVSNFLTGYQWKTEGVISPVSRREWGKHVRIIKDKTKSLQDKDKESYELKNYEFWLEECAKSIPTQAFVYLDELSKWYYSFIANYVDDEVGTYPRIYPESRQVIYIHYQREDHELVLDPIIPESVKQWHKAWFSICAKVNAAHQTKQIEADGMAVPMGMAATAKEPRPLLANPQPAPVGGEPRKVVLLLKPGEIPTESSVIQAIAEAQSISFDEARQLYNTIKDECGVETLSPNARALGVKGFDSAQFGTPGIGEPRVASLHGLFARLGLSLEICEIVEEGGNDKPLEAGKAHSLVMDSARQKQIASRPRPSKQHSDKTKVKDLWDKWRVGKIQYENKSEFINKMLETTEVKNPKTIRKWIKEWEQIYHLAG